MGDTLSKTSKKLWEVCGISPRVMTVWQSKNLCKIKLPSKFCENERIEGGRGRPKRIVTNRGNIFTEGEGYAFEALWKGSVVRDYRGSG